MKEKTDRKEVNGFEKVGGFSDENNDAYKLE